MTDPWLSARVLVRRPAFTLDVEFTAEHGEVARLIAARTAGSPALTCPAGHAGAAGARPG